MNTIAQPSRVENGARPSSSHTEVNEANSNGHNETGAVLDEVEVNKARDAKDRERWAKLKKLRQVFHVKKGKGKGGVEKDKDKGKSKGKENMVEVVD